MTEKKIYVTQENKAYAVCPECGQIQIIDATAQQIDRAMKYEIRCLCGVEYVVFVERRKYYRKKTDLAGVCVSYDQETISEINVENLSRTGVGFTINPRISVSLGDILKIRFVLRGQRRTIIDEDVVVKRIKNNYIGACFRRFRDSYPELAYYLKP